MRKINFLLVGSLFLLIAACTPPPTQNKSATGADAQKKSSTAQAINAAVPLQFSFFLEASGSMFGYGSPTSEFREAIYDLIARIPDSNEPVHTLNFVTDKAYPFEGTLNNFIANRDPYAPVKTNKKIPTNSSEFNEILKTALREAETDKVSVLVSDCVYSLKGGAAANQLVALKPLITNIFKPKVTDIELLVLQLESQYAGFYYDYNNGKHPFNGTRPYYVIVVAKKTQMAALLQHENYSAWQNFTTLKGYKNSAHFKATNAANSPYFSVLPLTGKDGVWSFQPEDPNRIKGITDCNLMGRKKLKFTVALDLSDVYAEESYKTDRTNFSLAATDKFTISNIEKIGATNVQNNDKHYLQSATHLLTIEADKLTVANQDLSLQLNAVLPAWVAESSNENDLDTHTNKIAAAQTFGFEPLMRGIYTAYHSSGSNVAFFTVQIPIKK